MAQVRRKLGKRFQNKSPLQHPRMRHFQIRCTNDRLAKQQDIDIYNPRPPRLAAFPPQLAFDILRSRQQLAWKKGRFSLRHLIQKPRLVENIARSCFICRRHANHPQFGRRKPLQRAVKIRAPISEIRSERKIGGSQNSVFCAPRTWRATLKYSKARSVATRPRGVRSKKPSCMRYGS